MSGGEIAGIVLGSFAATGVIWGIIKYILDRRQRTKDDQRKKLRTHFGDLKNEIMQPMIAFIDKIKNFEGELGLDYNIMGSYIKFSEDIDFEKNELFKSFIAHFPEIAGQWGELKGNILAHNQALALLLSEIGDWINETSRILLREWGDVLRPLDVPSINQKAPQYFWEYFLSRHCQDPTPTLDFNKARIEQGTLDSISRAYHRTDTVYVLRCGDEDYGFALTYTQEDAQKIKDCFITLQRSEEWVQKGTKILDNAKALEEKCKALKEDLNSTCEQYSKEYETLEKQKDCFICWKTFYKKKPWWKSLKFWS